MTFKHYSEICENCGHTYGSHCASTYYSDFYKREVPRDCCPGHEGRMDWNMGGWTTFKPTGRYKEKEMTPIQACKETKQLWTEMARVSVKERRAVLKQEIPGPWIYYSHECPCCEYAKGRSCSRCPMHEEWSFYSDDPHTMCEGINSPYNKWDNLYGETLVLCIDVEFFCLLIAEMAEEAIERLEKD